jgi:hypothetical protein
MQSCSACKQSSPMATFSPPVVLLLMRLYLRYVVVFSPKELKPTAVLFAAVVLFAKEFLPTAVLDAPVVFVVNA